MAEDDPYNGKAESEDSDDLAHDRTDMAEDRTVMAVERTFAGWIRTAFGAIAIGLGFKALFGAVEPWWVARAIASMKAARSSVVIAFIFSGRRRLRTATSPSRSIPISSAIAPALPCRRVAPRSS